MSDMLTEAESHADRIIAAIDGVERNEQAFYVQSFVVAAYGQPVVRMRWNAESQGFDSTEWTEGDAR